MIIKLLSSAIFLIFSASFELTNPLHIGLSHSELTIFADSDAVARGTLNIFVEVSDVDAATRVDLDASAV